jgi:hypothetical protein
MQKLQQHQILLLIIWWSVVEVEAVAMNLLLVFQEAVALVVI